MSDSIIFCENLGKSYRIRHQQTERYTALRDVIANKTKSLFRRSPAVSSKASGAELPSDRRPLASVPAPPAQEDFWALRDVSFEVRRGEVVGIIGRNGAGKSTLLKILSRITEPTQGRITLRGRVASLLEVGTGFHPELTGRENIFLNGAILGMHRAEIKKKFDEIVAFAEVEKFLDTPVKRYSSGMYVRLAFAVAAHLEPEILIVDEVLAVGDAQFQKKCLGKMGEVARAGRTVLFVSHNMGVVQNLCRRGLLLDQGRVVLNGTADEAVRHYLTSLTSEFGGSLAGRRDREGNGALRFKRLFALSSTRGETDTVCTGEEVTLVAEYETDDGRSLRNVSVSMPCFDHMGRHVFMCWTRLTGSDFTSVADVGRFQSRIKRLPLMPGRYSFNLWCEVNGVLADWVRDAGVLNVVEGDFFGTGYLAPSAHGGVVVDHEWTQA